MFIIRWAPFTAPRDTSARLPGSTRLSKQDTAEFSKIIMGRIEVPYGTYYEFLFLSILITICKNIIRLPSAVENVTEHYDVEIDAGRKMRI